MKMNICSQCQKEVAADSPGGLCPVCVLRGASESHVVTGIPPVKVIQAAFPQFRIEDCIGRGGMGIVYRANEVDGGRPVALKVLDPSFNDEADFAERFERETRMLGELKHPNIVSIYDFGKSEEFYWLTMELVDGVNLRQAMQTEKFTPKQALEVIPLLCSALQYAHENGVYHRDVKPENILLGTSGVVKVADFGIARMVGEKAEFTLTRTGSTMGTTAYLAPEQIESPGDVDHRADIYSLGVVFYEMLTGSLPLGRFPAPSAKSESHPDLDEVVFRALEKERELRYQHAGDFSSGLRGMSGKVPVSEEKHRISPEVFAGITLFGALLAIAGAFVSPLLLGIGVATWLTGTALCWYILRSESAVPKGQRQFLKWVSVGIPVGLVITTLVSLATLFFSYSAKDKALAEERDLIEQREKQSVAERLVEPVSEESGVGEFVDQASRQEKADVQRARHNVEALIGVNEALENVVDACQKGDVELLKSLCSDELLEKFPTDPDLGKRLEIGWAQVEAQPIQGGESKIVTALLAVARLEREGEIFNLVLTRYNKGWRVTKLPSKLFWNLELSVEDSIKLVVEAAKRRDEKVFELHVMPNLLDLMRKKDGNLKEAMREFSELNFPQLEVRQIEPKKFAIVSSREDPKLEIYFRFHENRWKFDIPEEEKESVAKRLAEPVSGEPGAGEGVDQASLHGKADVQRSGDDVEASAGVNEAKEDSGEGTRLVPKERTRLVRTVGAAVAAMVSAAKEENEVEFRKYVTPGFISVNEKKYGGLQRLMGEFAKIAFTELELEGLRAKFDKVGLHFLQSDFEVFLKLQGERWMIDISEKEKEMFWLREAESESGANVSLGSPDDSEELSEITKAIFAPILDAAARGNEKGFRKFLAPDFAELIQKKDGGLKELMEDLATIELSEMKTSGVKDKFEKVRMQSVVDRPELLLRRHGERWLLDASEKGKEKLAKEISELANVGTDSFEPLPLKEEGTDVEEVEDLSEE